MLVSLNFHFTTYLPPPSKAAECWNPCPRDLTTEHSSVASNSAALKSPFPRMLGKVTGSKPEGRPRRCGHIKPRVLPARAHRRRLLSPRAQPRREKRQGLFLPSVELSCAGTKRMTHGGIADYRMSALMVVGSLDNESVEGGEDGRWEMCLPQPSQEVETLLGFLGYGAGVGVDLCQVNCKKLGALDDLHSGAVDVEWRVVTPSEVNNHLFGLGVECSIYFANSPPCADQARIAFVVSLLIGKALDWATAVWPSYERGTYEDFIKDFKAVFDHPNEGTGWNEPALLTAFRHGLHMDIRKELAYRHDGLDPGRAHLTRYTPGSAQERSESSTSKVSPCTALPSYH
ncbi:hypothetical protein NFI96_002247 [Prochilodus magdalenae]|nr:hypothetical protein NFI96_002247 [Prochilodus magdalenae]